MEVLYGFFVEIREDREGGGGGCNFPVAAGVDRLEVRW